MFLLSKNWKKAISKIIKNNKKWKIKIIGNNKNFLDKNKIKSLLKSYNLDQYFKQISFLGFLKHSSVINHFKKSSIVVVPSMWEEPFGRVAIEGLASRNVVIASKIGGLKEILEKNRGVFFKWNDVENLAQTLNKFMQNYKLRRKYFQNSVKKFPYYLEDTTKYLDELRASILNSWKT